MGKAKKGSKDDEPAGHALQAPFAFVPGNVPWWNIELARGPMNLCGDGDIVQRGR